ncbi:MAG: hypothetical protein ABI224_00630 [Acetobacteraceae bacterium]
MGTFMRLGGVFGVGFLAGWSPITQAAATPPPAISSNFVACPKAGTISKGRSTLGEYANYWQGTDPSDPTVCLGKSVSFDAATSGKPWRRMYALFDLTFRNWQQGEDQARTALGLLLSGQTNKVSFSETLTKPGESWIQTWRETWERTGVADVTVGNRTIKATVFRRTQEGRAGNGYLGTQQLWYDPATHLWIKGHLDVDRGYNLDRDFEMTSIVTP